MGSAHGFGKYNQAVNGTLFESDENYESGQKIREIGTCQLPRQVLPVALKLAVFSDLRYDDPLGPPPDRPRTSVGRKVSEDDFGDEELGDLLPE